MLRELAAWGWDMPACGGVPCNAVTLLALSPSPVAPKAKLGLFPARCWFA